MSISNCVLAICKQYDTGMWVPCLLDADDIFIEYLKTLSITILKHLLVMTLGSDPF